MTDGSMSIQEEEVKVPTLQLSDSPQLLPVIVPEERGRNRWSVDELRSRERIEQNPPIEP